MKHIIIIFLYSFVTLAASNKAEPCPDTARLPCGSKTYNPLSEVCCEKIIGSLGNMTHPDCCGNQVYDRSTHLCCSHNGKADSTDISAMAKPECCGVQAYDVTVSKCCEADVKESMPIVYQPQIKSCKHSAKVDVLPEQVPYDMSTAACGCGVSYKTKIQKCCPGNVVLDVPANMTNPDCCGKTIYDQGTQKCCAGKLHDISGTVQPSCCGTSGAFFDQASELCCDGTIKYFHGLGSPACCGKEAFDSETHECAGGKVRKVTKAVKVSNVPGDAKAPNAPPKFNLPSGGNVKDSNPLVYDCKITGQTACSNFNSLMHTIAYPAPNNLKHPFIACCKPKFEGAIIPSNCKSHGFPYQNKVEWNCPNNQFINYFCKAGRGENHCDGNGWVISCCTYTWSKYNKVVEPDECEQVVGFTGTANNGKLICDNNSKKFMTSVCNASGPNGCTGNKGFSATCCTPKRPKK